MISVVIPALNEEKALPRTLGALFRQAGDYEVILADGGSSDATVAVAARWPAVRVVQAPKGRASQMNAGAKIGRGEWLLFLHADTLLPEGALRKLNALETHPSIQAGGFHQRFSGDDPRLRLISWLHNARCRITRVFYGDQAMFVRRRLFETLGGFPDMPMLEDVAFCDRLVRATRPVLLDEAVITDARKFESMGVWRSLGRVVMILITYEMRLPIACRKFFREVR